MPSYVRIPRPLARAVALLAMLAVPLGTADAQSNGTIRGRVMDASNQRPIAEAQVSITGTTLGSVTNANGDYAIINVPSGQREVVARRLGYTRQTRTVTVGAGADTRVEFSMSVSATQLEQMVVTGTGGSAERKTLGNSITTIDVAELTQKASIMNVSEVLQSKTPGVTILPGSGAPGTAGEIRIRGASSLSGYKPVVFIDGIRFNIEDLGQFAPTGAGTAGLAQSAQVTSALNNLNPNDIESIEVIKGPAAATLYGAEAANGVIQIITKKGTRGQQNMQWNIKAERGTNEYYFMPEQNYTFCDATKQAATTTVAGQVIPLWTGCQGVPAGTILTDNPLDRDERATRVGNLSRLSLSTRGGGDRYQFYVAGDRDTEQGYYYTSDNNRTSVRSNFGFSPNDKLNVMLNLNWQEGRIRLPIQDESPNSILLSARRGLPGRYPVERGLTNEGWSTVSPDGSNRYQNYTDTERYTFGGTFTYSPWSFFQNRLTMGIDNTISQAQLLFLPGIVDINQDADAASGANFRRVPTRRVVTIDYAGTFNWDPSSNLKSTTTFGSQVIADKSETLGAQGIGIGAPDVTLVNLLQRSTGNEAYSENNSVGYYVQEQLGISDRLFLTAAVRADDHSSFGTDFDLIVYPKLSASYVISDEPRAQGFLSSAKISSLKLRTAWGRAGRAPTAYSAPQTYTIDRVMLSPTVVGSALRTSGFGNPDLKSETGSEIELGFDAGMFSERLGIDFTYYNKTTSDMLQSVGVAPSLGFVGNKLTNLGEVSNKGVELALFGRPVQTKNFDWDTRLTYATNENKLVTFGITGRVSENPTGQAYGVVQQHREGYPLGGYWILPARRDANGVPLLTAANAAIFAVGDTARVYAGTPSPKREIGFSNTFTLLRNFRVYALLDHKGGHHLFNLQERGRCQAQDNCAANMDPRARAPQTAADSVAWKELAVRRGTGIDTQWIQKADFTKLREVSLTYDAPASMTRFIGGRGASITLSGRNLAIWSDYPGADPEVSSYGGRNFVRVDAYAAPAPRRFSASINLQY